MWFYSKHEAINFNGAIANDHKFKFLKDKANLSENSRPDGANAVTKNATNVVSLKYLSNFWRSGENPLINCKVELKLKWINYCVLSATSVDNAHTNPDNIIFAIKDTKLYVPVLTFSARDNENLSKFLSKGFEKSVYWNEYRPKSEN